MGFAYFMGLLSMAFIAMVAGGIVAALSGSTATGVFVVVVGLAMGLGLLAVVARTH